MHIKQHFGLVENQITEAMIYFRVPQTLLTRIHSEK